MLMFCSKATCDNPEVGSSRRASKLHCSYPLFVGPFITHVNAVKISRIEDVRKLQTNRNNNKDSIPVLLEIVRGAQMQTVFLAVSP